MKTPLSRVWLLTRKLHGPRTATQKRACDQDARLSCNRGRHPGSLRGSHLMTLGMRMGKDCLWFPYLFVILQYRQAAMVSLYEV
jgi:hypothetical protein